MEAYPLLDELTSKISTSNLERVRRLKTRLLALTRRVQKVRDEIEQLMDDDGDMAEMYLTEKKRLMELQFDGEQSLSGFRSMDGGQSVFAPVSPVSSPPNSRRLDKSFSLAKSRHDGAMSSESANDNIEELEMLLEAYFVVIDSTLNKLTSLKEYIEDTEYFINIQLDTVRNQLIQFELLLTTSTFVVAIFGVVAAFFANLFAMEDIFAGSVNVSPKVKCPNIPIDEEIGELDDNIRVFGGTTHTVLLNTMQNRDLLDVQSVPHGLTAGSCSGLTFYNHFSDMTKNLNTKPAVKTYTAKSSTVMKPTASQLAKQNPRSQVRVGGSR